MFSLYTSAWHEAIVRGGRYEKVKTITGDSRPAVGFSFDVKKLNNFTSKKSFATDGRNLVAICLIELQTRILSLW